MRGMAGRQAARESATLDISYTFFFGWSINYCTAVIRCVERLCGRCGASSGNEFEQSFSMLSYVYCREIFAF